MIFIKCTCTSTTSFEEVLKDFENNAKLFSEGNPKLEEALKLLWNNGFETIGCCTGHEDKEKSVSYIGFKINNSELANKFLSSIDKSKIRISFVKNEANTPTFSVKPYGTKIDISLFDKIINAVNNMDNNIDNNIKKIIDFFNEYPNSNFICISLNYKDSKIENILFQTDDQNLGKKIELNYKPFSTKFGLYQFNIEKNEILDFINKELVHLNQNN